MTQEFNGAVNGGVAGRDIVNEAPKGPVIQIGEIKGGNNIIGQSGDIILQMAARPKIKVVIQPGPEHITDEQKARLRELVNEVVQLETSIKRIPKRHNVVWGALTASLKCTSYHLIPSSKYLAAEKFLMTWCARLRRTEEAARKDPDWRNSRYRYIYGAAKEIGRDGEIPQLLVDRYSGRSLKELSDLELEAVYRIVAQWKKQARQHGAV